MNEQKVLEALKYALSEALNIIDFLRTQHPKEDKVLDNAIELLEKTLAYGEHVMPDPATPTTPTDYN